MENNNTASINNIKTADLIVNCVGLLLFIVCFAALLVKHNFKIDRAALIICSLYPLGTIAQLIWRRDGNSMGLTIRSLIIIMHDLVVVSPSYFVYEMLKVQVIIQSSGIEEFILKNRRLQISSVVIATVLIVSSIIGAFCSSFGLHKLEDKNDRDGTIYIVGSVFFMIFFVTATIPYIMFLKSLSYFIRRKV
jgi:hypothetical protein